MIFDATTRSLEALMGGAAATTQPTYVVTGADHTASAFTPLAATGALNGTTAVTILAAPAASTQRQAKYVNIYNIDTAAQTITVRYNDNGAFRNLVKIVLEIGEQLIFSEGAGWTVLNAAGAPKAAGNVATGATYLPGSFDAANLTAVLSLTTNSSFMSYLGQCPKASTSVALRYRVTTAAATITWAEVGIFRGPLVLGGSPVLTRLGTLDVSGVINSTGQKTSTVTLSTAAAVGDVLWAVIGNQATTVAVIRGALADDVQSGVHAILAATRPSTVASPTTWTIGGAAVVLPWMTGFVN